MALAKVIGATSYHVLIRQDVVYLAGKARMV
jgi:hypothetical protein